MSFKFSYVHRQLYHTAFGVVGKNGKIYVSADDVSNMVGRPRSWGKDNASCMLHEILPDCVEPDEWVFEIQALLSMLRYYMCSGYRRNSEQKLYDALQYSKFSLYCPKENVYYLDECEEGGKTFVEWILTIPASY